MSHSRINPQLAWEQDAADAWEKLNPASRGPCRICKVDEEDHGCGHVWKFYFYWCRCIEEGCMFPFDQAAHDKHEYEPPEPVRNDT